MKNWISVDIAVPKKCGDYFVLYSNGSEGVSRYNVRRSIFWDRSYWSMEKFCKESIMSWSCDINGSGWISIDNPPKEEGEYICLFDSGHIEAGNFKDGEFDRGHLDGWMNLPKPPDTYQ